MPWGSIGPLILRSRAIRSSGAYRCREISTPWCWWQAARPSIVRSTASSRCSPRGRSSSILATASCRKLRLPMWSGCLPACAGHGPDDAGGSAMAAGGGGDRDHCRARRLAPAVAAVGALSLAQGCTRRRDHRLDGGNALSAAAVRLPLRGRAWQQAVGNLQGHGAPAADRDHQSGHGGELGARTVVGLGRRLVRRTLAANQGGAGPAAICLARLVRPLGAPIRR